MVEESVDRPGVEDLVFGEPSLAPKADAKIHVGHAGRVVCIRTDGDDDERTNRQSRSSR